MQEFLLQLLKTTATQIAGILGIFFIFGFILSKLQEVTQATYRQTIGWKGILFTAWFGTPIHELGHVFFAKIFRHKVEKISFFKPNSRTGGLGQVDHSYDKYSLYQRIGNFFIGGAPMIFGSFFMFLMLYFLVPNGREIFTPLSQGLKGNWQEIIFSIQDTFFLLFSPENLKAWNFWVFIYLSFCLSAHIAPSKLDRKQMWNGFIWLVLILLLFNILAFLFKIDLTKYLLALNHYLGIFTAIFIYTTIISLLHFVLSFFILWPLKKRLH